MDIYDLIIYIIVFLYGIVIGSFLNVCIFRIPKGESIAKDGSHCLNCGYQLKWYDNIPLLSWIILKGKCRNCKSQISPQYPIIEGINGIIYVVIFIVNGLSIESGIYCLMTSSLLALSVIDFRTYEIPVGFNYFITCLGIIHLFMNIQNWQLYVIGALAISLPLALLFYVSNGRAIGGGDVKLMAACGLVIGWKLIVLAFFIGCILGSVIHLLRMKLSNEDHLLAMGPYLSAGIIIAMLYGTSMINWYVSLF